MSDYKRTKCPACGENKANMLHDENDKSEILYYSMQGTPVYKKITKCGSCGNTFKRE